MSTVSYYTAEGLKKLREELNLLKDVERPRASQAIGEARDKGDLSENAEYDAAKEAQGMLEMKISKMEEILANARVIDESQLDVSKVLVLSKVRIKNLANNMEMRCVHLPLQKGPACIVRQLPLPLQPRQATTRAALCSHLPFCHQEHVQTTCARLGALAG